FSDNDGKTWSAPIRVNDDATQNSQFFPRLAVGQSTGAVAVTWYDARNDAGVPGQGSTNAIANDDAEFYGTVGTPTATGVNFAPNAAIQPAPSNAADSQNPNDYGDYTGLAFLNGSFYAS